MANHLTHKIQQGETVYSIATDKLGDTSQWLTLVRLNHLDFPYIVNTETEKIKGLKNKTNNGMPDQKHWLTYGDDLILPGYNRLSNPTKNSVDKHTYDNVMGMDLALSSHSPSTSPGSAYGDQVVYLRYNKNGDIATVTGNKNLLQSIALRLTTKLGSLPNHVSYGSVLHNFIGKDIEASPADTCVDVSNEIMRTVNTDQRVQNCKVEHCHLYNENFFAIIDVQPISPYRAFSMYIESINGSISTGLNS